MRSYPQFSFWISITLVKICFSRIFSKLRKNIFELVGTVLKWVEQLTGGRMSVSCLGLWFVSCPFKQLPKQLVYNFLSQKKTAIV